MVENPNCNNNGNSHVEKTNEPLWYLIDFCTFRYGATVNLIKGGNNGTIDTYICRQSGIIGELVVSDDGPRVCTVPVGDKAHSFTGSKGTMYALVSKRLLQNHTFHVEMCGAVAREPEFLSPTAALSTWIVEGKSCSGE